MTRRENAYSYVDKLLGKGIDKGLKDLGNSDSIGSLAGALAGSALAYLIVNSVTKNLVREIEEVKGKLDATYTPHQRYLAKEIETLNAKIYKTRVIAKTAGFTVGKVAIKVSNNAAINDLIGAQIGTALANKLADGATMKIKEEMENLLIDYDHTLSPEQKKLRVQLDLALKKKGLRWTLGIVGGGLIGSYLGRAANEVYEERKLKNNIQ